MSGVLTFLIFRPPGEVPEVCRFGLGVVCKVLWAFSELPNFIVIVVDMGVLQNHGLLGSR